MAIVSQIKNLVNPVPCTLAFKYWKPLHNFVTICSTARPDTRGHT